MSETHCIAAAQPREVITRAEAKAAGLKWYCTGNPCKHGHLEDRQTSNGRCRACGKDSDAGYRQHNPDRFRAKNSRYRANNPEKIRQFKARDYAKNHEKIRNSVARYQTENSEKVRQYREQYYKKNRHKIKQRKVCYQAENPEKRRAAHQLRRARKRQATPPWFGELDAFVWQEAAHLAVLREDATGIEWHCDHLIPIACKKACGLHTWNNVQVIPASVNIAKNNKLILTNPGEWLRHL